MSKSIQSIDIDYDQIDRDKYLEYLGLSDILSYFGDTEVIKAIGYREALDIIGQEECQDHFGLLTKVGLFDSQLGELVSEEDNVKNS